MFTVLLLFVTLSKKFTGLCMSFTERDYKMLSYDNRIKKLVFTIKEFFNGKHDEEYVLWLIDMFNRTEELKLQVPKSMYDWNNLYSYLVELLLKENKFLSPSLFDDQNRERRELSLKILLDNIRSPFNVGAIARTAEAFAVEELIVTGITPVLDDKKVQKTAMGVNLKWRQSLDAVKFIKEAKKNKIKIYALEKSINSKKIDAKLIELPAILVVGNEEFGVSKELLELSDDIFHIDMYGRKNSLNVAVATAISLYEICKKIDD